MMAAAGPWAALAAVIAANETYQNKEGNRPNDFGEQVLDGFTGKSMQRDMEKYLGDDVGGFIGSHGSIPGMADNIKKSLQPWEWF